MKELIFGFIGGTALLIYGVDKMGDGLEKASGNVMKKIFTALTGNVWSAFLVGIFITALVQSSTAVTVLTVGFVNSGLMNLSQAVGIIYGANIGTTITAQLMALSFKFKLTEVALPILGIGFAISSLAKKETIKNLGNTLMGFGFLFLGLRTLNEGIPYIQESETLIYFFKTYASIPIIAILLGICVTALVHSSSAVIGLVLILSQAGLLDLHSAIYIMLGDNIGTCLTAQLASLTGNIDARRTAWAHTLYNLIGVIIVCIFFNPFVKFIQFITLHMQGSTDLNLLIANSHTLFNVLNSAIFLPLNKYYVKFLETVITDKKDKKIQTLSLDRLLLETPIAAFKAALSETVNAAIIAKEMLSLSMDAFYSNDIKKLKQVEIYEENLNRLQKDITSYVVSITNQPLTEVQSRMVPALITSINNIERAGDHTIDILQYIEDKIENDLPFSDQSIDDLKELEEIIMEMFDCTIHLLNTHDINLRKKVKDLEDTVDDLSKMAADNHLERLKVGTCSVEPGVVFLDIVTHLERIADHIYKVSMMATNEFLEMSVS